MLLLRFADRHFLALLFQLPPPFLEQLISELEELCKIKLSGTPIGT